MVRDICFTTQGKALRLNCLCLSIAKKKSNLILYNFSFCIILGVCSFDNGFCQWRNEASEDQFDWSIVEGETPSKGTGPMTGFGGSGNLITCRIRS